MKDFGDIAGSLWGVVANVDNGNWNKQSNEWIGAARNARNHYHAAIANKNGYEPINSRLADELTQVERRIARAMLFLADTPESELTNGAMAECEQALKDIQALKVGQQIL